MSQPPEEDFSTLSIIDRIHHKSWKARVHGYDELSKHFKKLDPDTQEREFLKYQDFLKKFVIDSNVAAQEAGMNAVLAYVENYPNSIRIRTALAQGIVEKAINSARASIKTTAAEILMVLIDLDIPDPIMDEIINGLSHKQPKLVTACVFTLKEIVRLYGLKTVNPKPILKILSKIFGHSDKNVRAEAFTLTLEMYKWIGEALLPSLKDLKPVQLKDLHDAFEKLPDEKPKQLRLLRSQQEQVEIDATTENVGEEASEIPEEENEVDPYDLADPVDVLSKLPKNFYSQLASSKWKERKEVLDNLLIVVKNPKIAEDRYHELIGILSKKVSDTNINVATVSVEIIGCMAQGLRRNFAPYKSMCLPAILEKLKEKKQTVVEALRTTLDAIFLCVQLSDIVEDVTPFTSHRNPQIRTETIRWLVRIFKVVKTPPSKPEIKTLAEALLKSIEDGVTDVRDASAEALGTLMKICGEKALAVYLEKLDKIKEAKVSEYFEKAEVKCKSSSGPPRPTITTTATLKSSTVAVAAPSKPTRSKPLFKKKAPASSKPSPSSSISSSNISNTTTSKPSSKPPKQDFVFRFKYTSEVAENSASQIIPAEILSQISSSSWKTRLAGMEEFMTFLETQETVDTELIVHALAKKPGFKDSNFQVLTKVFNCLLILARHPSFDPASAALAIPGLIEKLGDIKLKKIATECLMQFSEALSLQFVLSQSYDLVRKQKSPKSQLECLIWVETSIIDFGVKGINLKPLIEFLKLCLNSANANIRNKTIAILGLIRTFVGPGIRSFFTDINSAQLSSLDTEFNRLTDKNPPSPTRTSTGVGAIDEDPIDSLFPKVDLSQQITPKIMDNFNSSNWKARKESLDQVGRLLDACNNRIRGSLGDLPNALKSRLSDNNKNLVVQTLELIGRLAVALGKPFERYQRVLLSSVITTLTDNKAQIRSSALQTLTNIASVVSFETLVPSIGIGLGTDSAILRKDLLSWLSQQLKVREECLTDLSPLISPVIQCLQDKNNDVRKQAQSVLRYIVIANGYETVKDKVKNIKSIPIISIIEQFKDLSVNPIAEASYESLPTVEAEPVATVPVKKSSPLRQVITPTSKPVEPSSKLSTILNDDSSYKDTRSSSKWPSEVKEQLDTLRSQMSNHINPMLMKQLFSASPSREKDQISALTKIDELIIHPENEADAFELDPSDVTQRILSHSDLLFKCACINVVSSNPSVVNKCLDIIQHLVDLLDLYRQRLADFEGRILLPSLIQKFSDPKDSIRSRIKDILHQIYLVYPPSCIFPILLDHGLRSRIPRIRILTFEELNLLIEKADLSTIAPVKTLPVIASFLKDKDPLIRRMTTDFFSIIYRNIGNSVFQYLNKLSEQERIGLEKSLKKTTSASSSNLQSSSFLPMPNSHPTVPSQNRFGFQNKLRPPSKQAPPMGRSQSSLLRPPSRIETFTRPNSASSSPPLAATARATSPFGISYRPLSPETRLSPPGTRSISPYSTNTMRPQSLSPSNPHLPVLREFDLALERLSISPSVDSFRQFESFIASESAQHLTGRTNEIIRVISSCFSTAPTSFDDASRVWLNTLISITVRFFANPLFVPKITLSEIQTFLLQLVRLSSIKPLKAHPPIKRLLKEIILSVDSTNLIISIFNLISDHVDHLPTEHDKNTPYFAQAEELSSLFYSLMHAKEFSINKLRLDEILLTCHEFYLKKPPSYWSHRLEQGKPLGDYPHRLVKYFLNAATRTKEYGIVNYFTLFDYETSPVYQMIVGSLNLAEERSIPSGLHMTQGRPSSLVSTNHSISSNTSYIATSSANLASNSPSDISNSLDTLIPKIEDRRTFKQGVLQLQQLRLDNPALLSLIDQKIQKDASHLITHINRELTSLRESSSLPVTLISTTPIEIPDNESQKYLYLKKTLGVDVSSSPPRTRRTSLLTEVVPDTKDQPRLNQQFVGLRHRLANMRTNSDSSSLGPI